MASFGDYTRQIVNGSSENSFQISNDKSNKSSENKSKVDEKIQGASSTILENKNKSESSSLHDNDLFLLNKEKIKQIEATIKKLEDSPQATNSSEKIVKLNEMLETLKKTQLKFNDYKIELQEEKKDKQTVFKETQTANNAEMKENQQLNIQGEQLSIQNEQLKTQIRQINIQQTKSIEAINYKQSAKDSMQYLHTFVGDKLTQVKQPSSKEEGEQLIKSINNKEILHCKDGVVRHPKGMKLPFKEGDKIPIYDTHGQPILDQNGKSVTMTIEHIHEMSDEEFDDFTKAFTEHINDTWVNNQPANQLNERSNKPTSTSQSSTQNFETVNEKSKTETLYKTKKPQKANDLESTTKIAKAQLLEIMRVDLQKKIDNLRKRIAKRNQEYNNEKYEEAKKLYNNLNILERELNDEKTKKEIKKIELEINLIENKVEAF